jgi:hypothetical protein
MTPDYLSRWLVIGVVLALPFAVLYCDGDQTPIWVGLVGLGVLGTCAAIGKVVETCRNKR